MSIGLTSILQRIQGFNTFFRGPNAGRETGVVLEDSATVSWSTDGYGNIQATVGGSSLSGPANEVYATPAATSGAAALRSLVTADLPLTLKTVGPQLTSAATIAPTASIHHITGDTTIETITPPTGANAGWELTLIPDSAPSSFTAAIGSTSTASLGSTSTSSIGSTNTAAIGSTSTGTSTGTSIALTSLTGFVSIGDKVSGTGITAGTTVISQTSGTTGLAGTYVLSTSGTAVSATITTFGTTMITSSTTGLISVGDTVSGGAGFPVGATVVSVVSTVVVLSAPATAYVASATGVTTFGIVLKVNSGVSGVLHVGDTVSGSGGFPVAATIVSLGTGTGGTGTYNLSAPATAYTASASGVTTFGPHVDILSALTGLISIGETISGGAGFPVAATIVSQSSGTTGSTGVYVLSAPGTAYVASASGVTTFGTVLKVSAVTAGDNVAVGDVFTGTNVPANATIVSQTSGTTGGVGVYTFTPTATQYVASETMTSSGQGTETGGNIALASIFVLNKALILTYDGTLFYPSY